MEEPFIFPPAPIYPFQAAQLKLRRKRKASFLSTSTTTSRLILFWWAPVEFDFFAKTTQPSLPTSPRKPGFRHPSSTAASPEHGQSILKLMATLTWWLVQGPVPQ